jgi:hypothetical protein
MPSERTPCPDCGRTTSADTIHTCSPQGREPIRVEVEPVCFACGLDGYRRCPYQEGCPDPLRTLSPDSYYDRVIRLGLADLAVREAADAGNEAPSASAADLWDRKATEYELALALVRTHPDHKAGGAR